MDDVARDLPDDDLRAALYPEVRAGGYTRHDGFVDFYQRVNALLDADSQVLDFGAGRGSWQFEPLAPYHRRLRAFHERVARVVGVDVDPVVLDNRALAEAHVIEPAGRIPYADASFDLALADYVLEHVDAADAETVAAELMRVVKPGGWLAARTPNKWGMIGIGARAVPNEWHVRVLTRLQPERQAQDVFPVRYSMNTKRDLKRLFPEPHEVVVYGHASEPVYFGRDNRAAWRAAQFIDALTPPALLPTLMVFVRRAP
ncbi:methyltransferase domain-containing protein [Nocardioides sp. Kera G14]|uniref:methyltransferase domain-containing protein n=1 Tax=Nocardioides sp. Kera G14 TaxID=2884264 RepID=UPI001D10F3FB|nr:methyltransferase domain-containing protein [Nocardioides sp. Kera G14]UDY23605.1 class I SAM-dependent methyltransferase [Nocardioides sp. Kera G14]